MAGGRAAADGALPGDQAVAFPDGGRYQAILATNFGLVLLAALDAGSAAFVCEQPHVAPPGDNVQLYQIGGGAVPILGESAAGLFHSEDLACSFAAAGGTAEGANVLDAAIDPQHPQRIVALISTTAAAGELAGQVVISEDRGATFGAPVWSGNALLTGVEFAPGRPGRLYLTGLTACGPSGSGTYGTPFLLISDDGGNTFRQLPRPELGPLALRIFKVDPVDSDTVYFLARPLVSQADSGGADSGSPPGGDRLAWTHDRGQSVQLALAAGARASGFALDADGTLAYASGRNLWVLPPDGGAFQAYGGGVHFGCLAFHRGELFACGSDVIDRLALGASGDRGASFCPRLVFQQISNLAACGAVAADCGAAFMALRQEFKTAGGLPGGACLQEADGGQVPVGHLAPPTWDAGSVACQLTSSFAAAVDPGDGGPSDAGSSDGGSVASSGDAGGARRPLPASGCSVAEASAAARTAPPEVPPKASPVALGVALAVALTLCGLAPNGRRKNGRR